MTEFAAPLLVAVFVWWFGTSVVLVLDGLPRRTFRWSMLGASAVMAAALLGLAVTGNERTPQGAYLAFVCGVLVWGWVELSFLTGFITGPRKTACAPGCCGLRHFGHGIQAMLYHEYALLLAGAAIAALTWHAPNRVGLATFAILWVMRQSTKLNLFLGVRNPSDGLLPEHLSHLKSYFRRKPMNLLFPVSVTCATTLTVVLAQRALHADTGTFTSTGYALLATLAALAVLEHWLLVLPLPVEAMWAWGHRKRTARRTRPTSDHAPLENAAARPAGELSS